MDGYPYNIPLLTNLYASQCDWSWCQSVLASAPPIFRLRAVFLFSRHEKGCPLDKYTICYILVSESEMGDYRFPAHGNRENEYGFKGWEPYSNPVVFVFSWAHFITGVSPFYIFLTDIVPVIYWLLQRSKDSVEITKAIPRHIWYLHWRRTRLSNIREINATLYFFVEPISGAAGPLR